MAIHYVYLISKFIFREIIIIFRVLYLIKNCCFSSKESITNKRIFQKRFVVFSSGVGIVCSIFTEPHMDHIARLGVAFNSRTFR